MTEYLFSPSDVSAVLSEFPLISQTLTDPHREGELSSAFPSARKSAREIYRVLSNQHYPHLRKLLGSIEGCGRRGWIQPDLLTTRSLAEFDSAVAVLGLAEHLVELGLVPKNADTSKKASSVPDIYVETPCGSLCIEVYVPRDWQGFDYFLEEARLRLLHVDCSLDYEARFSITSPLTQFNVWRFSELYENEPRRLVALDRILAPVAQCMKAGQTESFEVCATEPAAPGIEFRMNFDVVQPAQTYLPGRSIILDTPTLTGYAPEAMFMRLLARRIVPKLRKNQCGWADSKARNCRILFIATHMLAYEREFDLTVYRRKFVAAIQKILPGESQSIDAVAFGSPVPFSVAILACLTKTSEEIARYVGANEQSTILRMA